jgi:beta-phosphoglucomutase-like phosphatase (HAD superfamily)
MSKAAGGGSRRPFTTVLDVLRTEMTWDAIDAALFSIEAVAADLGYGDIRALPGSVQWIEDLRRHGKRVGLFATGERSEAALELAGIGELFDEVTIGALTYPTLLAAIDALGVEPARTVVATATAAGVAGARDADVFRVIALARGFSTPEELRRAGADMVVADLQELLRAIT